MPDPGFLGVPGVDAITFAILTGAAVVMTWVSIVTGAAGGLMLLLVMAGLVPAPVLVPIHTIVQLGAGTTRAFFMWDWVLKGTLLPFLIGSVVGAALGAQIAISLPVTVLQGLLGLLILAIVWMPRIGRVGAERGRFAIIGFLASFLGMFVSATGMIVGPFVASASPERRNHVATMSALMTISHICKISAFAAVGLALSPFLPLIVAMMAGAALGNRVGERHLGRMNEGWFRQIFKAAMTILALRLIWTAILTLPT